jgi:nitrate reductase assembly molybdenum cofactor insertion protein NarJ
MACSATATHTPERAVGLRNDGCWSRADRLPVHQQQIFGVSSLALEHSLQKQRRAANRVESVQTQQPKAGNIAAIYRTAYALPASDMQKRLFDLFHMKEYAPC